MPLVTLGVNVQTSSLDAESKVMRWGPAKGAGKGPGAWASARALCWGIRSYIKLRVWSGWLLCRSRQVTVRKAGKGGPGQSAELPHLPKHPALPLGLKNTAPSLPGAEAPSSRGDRPREGGAGPGPSGVGSAVGDAGPGGMGSLLCQRVTRELDLCYSTVGSLFHCGFRQMLSSNQLMGYADLYTAARLSFLRYPLGSLHRAAPELVSPCRASLASLTLCPRRTLWSPAPLRAFEVARPSLPPPGGSGSKPCRELWAT